MTALFRRLWVVLCFVAVSVAAPNANAQTYTFRDAGMERQFELSLDEVAVTKGGQRREITSVAPAAGVSEIRQYSSLRSRSLTEEVNLVLYELSDGERISSPRIVTRDVLVEVEPGTDAATLVLGLGAQRVDSAGNNRYIATAADSASALDLAARLKSTAGIVAADPLLAHQQSKRFIPNDPLFTNQWHLRNIGQFSGATGVDVRVTNVWNTYRGTNIYIGIIDDGMQTAHPDLAANVDTSIDWDFNFNDNDPNHSNAADGHGTSCAGVAAGVGNNSLGISGAAPEAKLVGLRLISATTTDSDEASAMNWSNSIIHIKSNSWGPNDDGARLEGPGALTEAAMSNACYLGRGGRGVLIFWAGGNGKEDNDDSNYDGYANSIYSIAIGAVANTGIQSYYSEPGANLIVCAPSSGDNSLGNNIGIWTTDRTGSDGYVAGDYESEFGGTSSATPLCAGVGALILQSNTNLTWRDMKEILIRSATRNHAGDLDWRANAAGLWFNHKYGGGMINASGAVAMATTWTNLGPQVRATTNQTGLSVSIPDNNAAGIVRTFNVTNNLRLENVVVKFSATHPSRGNLKIELISPGNTTSVLANVHSDSGDNFTNWNFMTVRNWGESAAGTWTLRVADRTAGNVGTLTAASLILYGTSSIPPSNQPPVIVSIGAQTVVVGSNLSFPVTATDLVDNDPITLTASNLPPLAVFGSTNGAGSFVWVSAGPAGVYTSTFFAADNDGTATQSVVITCRTNEPPVLAPIGNKTAIISNALTFAVTASDPVGNDTITLSVSNLPAGASFGATNGVGNFNWPNASPTGTYNVSFYASDISGADNEAITITIGEQPLFVTYSETFDTTANWAGGIAGSYNAKTYTNNDIQPFGDGFSGNSTIRDTTDPITGNAWRLGNDSTANIYVRYSLTNSVTRFAMQLARWDNSPTPAFVIRYSTDSGANYTTLLSTNGSWFTGDKTYQAFDSGLLSLTPSAGQQIYIELFRSTGERMLMDNFEVDYIPSGGAPAQSPPVLNAIGPKSVTVSNALNFAVTAAITDGDTVTLSASNLPSGAVFGSTNEVGSFSWSSASPVGVYTASFYAVDNDGVDSEAVVITVNASGGGGGGCSNVIVFQGFEAGDNWTIAAGGQYASNTTGSADTPANQRIRTGTTSWQAVGSGLHTVSLTSVSISGYTNRQLSARLSATSITSGNGVDSGDSARFFVALNGATFSATPDIYLNGGATTTNNGRWGFWATNRIETTAGTAVSNQVPVPATSTNNYANFFINIPDSATSIAFRVMTDADANEIWNLDDVALTGCSAESEPDPDSDVDGILDQWELDHFGSLTNVNETSDWDGDFFIDLHEFLAGTEPNNTNSFLYVDDSALNVSGGIIIQWPGVTGKTYAISRTTNLLDYASYQFIASNIVGVTPLNIYTDNTPAAGSSAYRIELQIIP